MIIMYDIINNISIYHLSYSGVYQDKSEKWELNKEVDIFGLEPK